VPGPEFFFALELSSQGVPSTLLAELATQVLGHVGCSGVAIDELTAALQQAVKKGSTVGERRCDVQFQARSGELEVIVSSNGGRLYQTSYPIP